MNDKQDIKWVGNKGYITCFYCSKSVQINKRLFGSTHICLTEEEIAMVDKAQSS